MALFKKALPKCLPTFEFDSCRLVNDGEALVQEQEDGQEELFPWEVQRAKACAVTRATSLNPAQSSK